MFDRSLSIHWNRPGPLYVSEDGDLCMIFSWRLLCYVHVYGPKPRLGLQWTTSNPIRLEKQKGWF